MNFYLLLKMLTTKIYSNIRKYALTGLLLLATGFQSNAPQKIPNKTIANIEQVSNSKIKVNKGVGSTYYMSRLDVENNLDKLCRDKNNFVEDAWMFHNDTLTDIGLNEDTLSVIICELPLYATIYNTRSNDTIILYHIHPNSYAKNAFSPPSATDIINHGLLKPRFSDKKIHLIERVFDGRGMWELDVNDQIVQKINKNNGMKLEEYIYMNSLINNACNTTGNINNTIQKDNTLTFLRYINPYNSLIINEYIQVMNKAGVRLNFTPKEIIGKL